MHVATEHKSEQASIVDVLRVCLLMAVALLGIVWYQETRTGGAFSALVYPDERGYYLSGANAIIAQGLEWYVTPRALWNGPLNPLWVSLFKANVFVVKIANLGLFATSGLALWDIARRLFGKRAAYLALLLLASYLPFYEFTPTILTEPLYIPMLLIALWLVVAGRPNKKWFDVGAGIALGLATLVRPTTQLYPLALVGLAAVISSVGLGRERWQSERALRRAVAILVGFVIIVLPYMVKNIVTFDRAVISNGLGSVLYLGSDLRKHGYEPVDSSMRFDTSELTAPFKHFDTEGDRILMKEALRRIRQDPLDVIALQPSKLIKLTFGAPEHYFRPQDNVVSFVQEHDGLPLLRIWYLLSNSAVVAVGVVGIAVLRPRPFAYLVMWSLVVYFALAHTLLFPIPRLFLPAIPILMVFAGGLMTRSTGGIRAAGLLLAASACALIAFWGAFDGVATVNERYVGYFHEAVARVGGEWNHVEDMASSGGALVTSGDDPYVVFDLPDFEAGVNQIVFLTMSVQPRGAEIPSTMGQVFWRSPNDGFAEERSELFELAVDGRSHIYAVSPSFRRPWDGVIDELRIDLPDGEVGLHVTISEVEVRK